MTLTGGWYLPGNYVSMYNTEGFIDYNASLQTSRWGHGCGYFIDENIGKVNTSIFHRIIKTFFQVLIVAGGFDDFRYNYEFLSSTEILYPGDDAKWEYSVKLPSKMFGIQSLQLENTIYLTGNIDGVINGTPAKSH